jgi:opacity protein-like surface antigen
MKHRLLIAAILALVALAVPAGATAKSADRDHDRMPDKWEKKFGLNTHKNDARKDKDSDGLRNAAEYTAGTNPSDADSDDDGVGDDDEHAGTIASFDRTTGALTINLFGGGTLTGKVDATTEIKCDDEGEHGTPGHQRRGADDQGGDDSRGNPAPAGTTQPQPGSSGPGNANDDGDDDEQGAPQQPPCDTTALTAGRTVKEAKLNEANDGPADVFHEIELVR